VNEKEKPLCKSRTALPHTGPHHAALCKTLMQNILRKERTEAKLKESSDECEETR
jgi:hypothetical protein